MAQHISISIHKFFGQLVICLLILLPLIGNAQGTVCNSGQGIILRSQAEVDNFVATYGDCNNVRTLRIEGNDITNLNGLSNIRFIGNTLYLESVPNLTNLNGLSNLRSIFGNLIIANNAKITNLDAFSNLSTLAIEVRIYNMKNLTSIEGLKNVSKIPRIRIFNNTKLADCCSIYHLINHPNVQIVSMYGNAGNCTKIGILADPNTSTISVAETDGTANDGAICQGTSAQLTASGTFNFEWAADVSLSATDIANPMASPNSNTTYSVTVRGCNNTMATKSTSITVNNPVTIAEAGTNQTQTNDRIFNLSANTPVVGTGKWAIVAANGSLSIANENNPNTTATLESTTSSATLSWTISNTSCSSTDEISLFTKDDQDQDGVENASDQCPNTPLGATINTVGCAASQLDGDKDGVSDASDQCLNTPSGAAVGSDGCSDDERDIDGDGVPDSQDVCIFGDDKLDIDGDGTPDYCDACNDLIDTDNDGTVDCYDECPNDPLKTIKDACGCGTPPQIDSDGDGIINCMDACPYDLNQYVDGMIECGKTIKGSSRLGQRIINNYGAYSEDFDFDGPELFYKLTVYVPTDLVIYYKEDNGNQGYYRTKLFVMNDLCAPDSCIGSITSRGETEMLIIPNAAAGDYFIAIDGRGLYDYANFELKVNCGVGGSTSALAACGEENLIFEDFQTYEEGEDIAVVGVDWELFGSSSQSTDVATLDEQKENKGLSFNRYKRASDVSLVIGNEHNGIWRVAWDMYIQPTATAYFNIMGLKGTEDYGVKYVTKQSDADLQNRWINVEVFIDLDNNRYELMMDNRRKIITGDYLVNLRKVNFYAAPYAIFDIDNVCVTKVESMPLRTSRAAKLESGHLQTKEELALANTNIPPTTLGDLKLLSKKNHQNLKIFPNPVQTTLTVQLPKVKQAQLAIFDILGKQVWTQSLSDEVEQLDLNIAHFEKGIYQLVVHNKEMFSSQILVKQ